MHHDKKPPIGRAIMRFWCLLGLSFISEIGYSKVTIADQTDECMDTCYLKRGYAVDICKNDCWIKSFGQCMPGFYGCQTQTAPSSVIAQGGVLKAGRLAFDAGLGS